MFYITEGEDTNIEDDTIYLGEPTPVYRKNRAKGPYSTHKPFITPIIESRELLTVKDRNYSYLEIAVASINLSVQTSDFITI